jgi:hypothetical protein
LPQLVHSKEIILCSWPILSEIARVASWPGHPLANGLLRHLQEGSACMAKRKDDRNRPKSKGGEHVTDPGRSESPIEPVDPEIEREFKDAQKLAGSGSQQLARKLNEHHSRLPELAGGDLDADWDRSDVGEESIGGQNPTPDQDIVEDLGRGIGITYEDSEPLKSAGKLEERDRKRWDLDPASSEDYAERTRRKPDKEGGS